VAIAAVERAETASTSNTASYTSASYTPSANALLVAVFVASATVTDPPTVTGNGLTWVEAVGRVRGTTTQHIFYALTGASPSTGGVTVNYGGDAATGCGITVVEFTGIDLTTPVGLADTNIGNATTPSITITGGPINATSAILGFVYDASTNPAAPTAPAGWTETTRNGWNTPVTGWEVAYHLTPGAISSVTWGAATSGNWTSGVVEILPAAVAAPGPSIGGARRRVLHARTILEAF
jgi:hypothetical protein